MIWLIVAIWAFFSLYTLQKRGFFKTEPYSNFQPSSMTISSLLGAFGVFFLVYAFVVPLVVNFWSLEKWKEVIAFVLFGVTFLSYVFFVRKQLVELIKPPGFFKGMSTWFFAFPVVFLWASTLEFLVSRFTDVPAEDQVAVSVIKSSLNNPPLFIVLMIFVVCLVPILEEILFRGFLQNGLKNLIGPRAAIILTALIFALFHGSELQGWSNLTIISSLFILGLFLGFLMENTKSLKAPIGLHMTYNFISLVMILVKEKL